VQGILRIEVDSGLHDALGRHSNIRFGNPVKWSAEQCKAILAETDRLLSDPAFKRSQRCVKLLRHLIEHALNGDQEGLKERTLGIEVFGRSPDYDTNSDPIVRMTANEIRKRLAQCYEEENSHSTVKIHLAPGAYFPQIEFERLNETISMEPADIRREVSELVSFPPEAVEAETCRVERRVFSWRKLTFWIVPGVLASCIAMTLNYFNVFSSTQTLMWAPIFKSNGPVTICVADVNAPLLNDKDSKNWAETASEFISGRKSPLETSPDGSVHVYDIHKMPSVPFVDVNVVVKVTSWLSMHRRQSSIRRYSTLTLENFRHGPVVFVGAFDNPWSLFLLSNLRYHVQVDPVTQDEWIEDAQNPSKRDWKGSGKFLYSDSSTDYAIISRVFHPDTGNWILSVGGLGMHGTEAAGELITDSDFANSLPGSLRSSKKNFQVVLKTTVIDGNPGSPQILAVYSW
jgi:hypothetical protein